MPIVLATQETEIRRQRSGGSWFEARPYLRKTHQKKRAGGVAQGVGPEFKP
jgi:hypothetical protein